MSKSFITCTTLARMRLGLLGAGLGLVAMLMSGCRGADEASAVGPAPIVATPYGTPEAVIAAFEAAAREAASWADLVYWERDDQRALMTLGALPPPAGALVVRSDDGARAIAAYSDADRRPHDLHLVRVGDRWWISGYTFEYDPDVVERRDECAAGAVLARLDFEWGLPDNRSRGVRPGFVKSTSDLDPYRGLRSAVIRGEDPSATLDVFDGFNSGLSAHPYRGKRIRLTAVVRSDRARRAAIWMRIDGADHPIAFDNMDPRPIVGTTGWRTYSVVLDVAPNAEQIVFGALLSGSGTVWVDDMVVEVVGLDVPSTALVVQP